MSGFARVDLDCVAPLIPGDKVAGRVAARGESFEYVPPETVLHSETPIETRKATHREKLDPRFVDLTGIKGGRLTVIGIAATSPVDKRRWVVRCQCGDYEVRRAKIIKSWLTEEFNGYAMCHECGYTQKLLRGQHNAKKAAAAEQEIQEMSR